VYYALWDTLSIEMRKEVDEVEILKQKRSVLANTLCLIGVRVRYTV
jgi:hypothetical protein